MPPDDHQLEAAVTQAIRMMQDKQQQQHQQPHQQQQQAIERAKENVRRQDKCLWRDLTAFWLLGMCNNYGYVVMLSAAHDIISRFGGHAFKPYGSFTDNAIERHCSLVSTGVLLLADTLPSMVTKSISPFLPDFMRLRMSVVCLFSALGFILVAFAQTETQALAGIIFTSISGGLGESSLLAYSSKYNKNVISTWSSGTGAAGLFGAVTYAGLLAIGMKADKTMLLMLIVPLIQAIAFFALLRRPTRNCRPRNSNSSITSATSIADDPAYYTSIDAPNPEHLLDTCNQPLHGIRNKLRYIPRLFKYILPMLTVYMCEYFINMGLYELIYYPGIWLDHDAQYRWFQVGYQIGVFLSRSSVNLLTIHNIWLLSLLQFFNVFYFVTESIYLFTPSVWITFLFVIWEGLLGGACYVNTFYRMSQEIPITHQTFALGIVPIGDSIGIILAGLLAIPAHNILCMLPLPN